MSIATIEQRVALWNLAKPVRINQEALADFKAEPARTPADYIAAGLKTASVWGAVYAAHYTATSGVVVSSKRYTLIGENYAKITNHKDAVTMAAHLDDIYAGVEGAEKTQDTQDDADGKAIAGDMKDILRVAKKAANHKAVPTDDNIKAAQDLLAFATANLARFELAKEVRKTAGKTTRIKTSK